MMVHRGVVFAAIAAVAVLALAGCAPSAAPAQPASDAPAAHTVVPTASATPTVSSGVLGIVLDASALSIEDASGTAVHTYPYNGGATDAIAELTSILGAPVSSTYVPPGKCWSDMTTVRWNTLRLMYYGQDPATTRLFLLDAVNTPPTTCRSARHTARASATRGRRTSRASLTTSPNPPIIKGSTS